MKRQKTVADFKYSKSIPVPMDIIKITSQTSKLEAHINSKKTMTPRACVPTTQQGTCFKRSRTLGFLKMKDAIFWHPKIILKVELCPPSCNHFWWPKSLDLVTSQLSNGHCQMFKRGKKDVWRVEIGFSSVSCVISILNHCFRGLRSCEFLVHGAYFYSSQLLDNVT